MRYSFGNCLLDTSLRELRRDGDLVPLEPKGYRVMLYLIEHRDRVATREELLAHTWPGVYVVDTAVSRCITLIRQAIGDSGTAQQVIKTLHGHGYRFAAPVDAADDAAAAPGPPPPAEAEPAPAPVPWRAHERRQVSVLCGVLRPNVALLPSLDAETLQRLFGELDQAVRRAVGPFDGHVLQLPGDRFSVVFGAPLAQEDHAERAALAALALRAPWIALSAAWASRAGQPVELGMGIHSGSAVVSAADEPAVASVAGVPPALPGWQQKFDSSGNRSLVSSGAAG